MQRYDGYGYNVLMKNGKHSNLNYNYKKSETYCPVVIPKDSEVRKVLVHSHPNFEISGFQFYDKFGKLLLKSGLINCGHIQ